MEIKGNYIYVTLIIISILPISIGAVLLRIVSLSGFFIAILFFVIIFYLYYGHRLHYYYLSDKSVTVKNLLYWWVNKEYVYTDIKKVKIYGRPDGNDMVIINSDKYISNNLKIKDFESMSDFFKQKNIIIEMELNI